MSSSWVLCNELLNDIYQQIHQSLLIPFIVKILRYSEFTQIYHLGTYATYVLKTLLIENISRYIIKM